MGRPKTLLLWCMSTVVFMLENDNRLPSLEQPAFAFKRTGGIADTSSYGEKTNSVNWLLIMFVDYFPTMGKKLGTEEVVQKPGKGLFLPMN
ncbi:hypothetical protein CDL15_Pgr016952 [Punica granatum]|uniref:Uncharacterized protein n=1 Tax=Punica granatum TaxID=22663 RepID=A0A218WXX3_PUNGR|nr:hypothetical protein CDL15_Pgr016952 [Punica granatum]